MPSIGCVGSRITSQEGMQAPAPKGREPHGEISHQCQVPIRPLRYPDRIRAPGMGLEAFHE